MSLAKDRIGMIGKNNYGSLMKVVEYNDANDIWVEFESGNRENVTWQSFCIGNVKNPYDKTVHRVGCIGKGKYKSGKNGKITSQYATWNSMLMRCYSEKVHQRQPAYRGCSVAEEWHNYQNFAKWYDENYYEVDGEIMCLDKDILVKGNKVYSPRTCIFVPQRINRLFVKTNAIRGEFPTGVRPSSTNSNKFKSECDGKYLGSYDTPEEAFISYKVQKEKSIKNTAEEYKNKIPFKLYETLINYKVQIND